MSLSTVTDYPVASTTLRYNRGSRMIYAFLSRPRDYGHYPGVMLLHDVEGLTDTYRQMTRRLARNDYVSTAPDLYSRAEVPKDKHLETGETRLAWFAKLDDRRVLEDLGTSWQTLVRLHWTYNKPSAVMGFGMGAYYAILYAGINPEVKACVAVAPQFLFDQPVPSRKELKAGAIDIKPHKFAESLRNMKADLITIWPGADAGMPADKAKEFLDLVDRQSITHTAIPWEGARSGFWLEGAESFQSDYDEEMWRAVLKYFGKRLR